jgi:DICT domain-containing protein
MEETLGAALTRMFGGVVSDERGSVAAAAPTAAATGVGLDQQVAELVREASRRYEEAIAAQQRGDWTTYGEQMRRVRELLQRLQELVGG